MTTRRNLLAQAMAFSLAPLSFATWAQSSWQAKKAIQVLVPGQAGGNSDIFARLITTTIGNAFGQPMVVENKPGASGTLASMLLSKSPADGHTLLAASSDTHTIYPQFFSNPAFHPEAHVPVAVLCFVPFALAVRKNLPVNNVKELVELAKKEQLTYSTWGIGTTGQAATMLFSRAAGIKEMMHVPFTGSAPAIQALMAGQVDVMTGAIPLISAARNQLKPLAVMSESRSPALKDIPTMAEAGITINDTQEFWVGLMAPPRTPSNIVDAIALEVKKAMERPEVKARIIELGAIPRFVGPAEFKVVISNEYKQWERITKEAGVQKGDVK